MKKITTPHSPDESESIFTEGIDYFKTGEESIWGKRDKETLELLNKEKISGRWLNLAAGDGRYNIQLLKKADTVTASDVDEGALSKLYNNTPDKYREKLQTVSFDLAQKFPFDGHYFDGVFCTGTLHLFPQSKLENIVKEIDRVLRPGGKLIIDFATEVKRILPDGSNYIREGEPQYSMSEAQEVLRNLLNNYKVSIYEASVQEEEIETRGLKYQFSCNFLLLVAEKLS
jgi:ubiquinone/menaquinone biosynthesis C-methylase UbiE